MGHYRWQPCAVKVEAEPTPPAALPLRDPEGPQKDLDSGRRVGQASLRHTAGNRVDCAWFVVHWRNDYYVEMSAVELLKHVEALPPRERRKFVLAVLALEEEMPPQSERRARHVKWPDVEARAKRVFGDRVLPNLVLVERDEAAF